MKLLFCSTDANYVIENLSAGDAVWLTMNARGMTAEKFFARFPDAIRQDRNIVGGSVEWVAIDEELK